MTPCTFADLHESHWSDLGRALNKALRHDRELPVDHCGYAWLDDLCYILASTYYRLKIRPVWQDVLSCCYFQNKDRFQAMSRSRVTGPHDTMMRCI